MQFNQTSGVSSPLDLIPRGQLAWAMVTFKGMKASQSGGEYADLELTLADNQPNARRKIFTKIGNPDHQGNSEGYRQMGMTSLTRMVEAANIVNPDDPNSYEKLNGMSCEDVCRLLDGKYVAIKVKIEPGKDGYDDKNDVGDFLTPNKQSQSNKNFLKLCSGDFNLSANPAARPQNGGGFGAQSGGTPQAPRQQGFAPQPQPAQQQAAPAASSGFNPNSAPSWMNNAQHR